jgi:nucleotide-binding universal stress UspA family protein
MSPVTNPLAARLFARVLVPHDFSDHATRALEIAAGLVEATGTVTVLHATPPVYTSMGGPAADLAWTPPPEMVTDLQRQLEALVRRVVGPERASRVRCRVVPADPVTAILDAAKRADAIVMTTLGRTGLGHLLMGSVAEKVVRHASIPVLTLHPEAAKRLTRKRKPAPARRRVSAR